MIAVDTSTWIAFFAGDKGRDVEKLDLAFEQRLVVLPPLVLAELYCAPEFSNRMKAFLSQIPQLEVKPGYWERSGLLRSDIRRRGFKANLPDALIAQSCLDHRVPLLTRDRDFRHFEQYAGLPLY